VLKHIQRALPGQRTDAGRLPWVMPTVLRREIRVDELTMGLLAGSGQVCSTAQYYQSIAVAPLVQQHARAQTIVATALGLQSPGAEEETVSDEGHRVGSLRVPRAQVMQQALKALDGDVASHAAGWFDLPSRWMQHHNAQVNRWA